MSFLLPDINYSYIHGSLFKNLDEFEIEMIINYYLIYKHVKLFNFIAFLVILIFVVYISNLCGISNFKSIII